MRRALALAALCLPLVGCGTPARWEKPGAGEPVTQQDLARCRVAARDEAARTYYPYFGPFFGPRHWLYWQRSADADRFLAENNLTNFCMRNLGYALVPITPQSTAPDNKGPEK
jgi:hypothetical protein